MNRLNFAWYFSSRLYNGGWFRWTQSLKWIIDDALDEGIDNNGGDSPDDEKFLVSLQPTPERFFR